MRIKFKCRFFSVLFVFSLLLLIATASRAQAEIAGPGWVMETAEPVSVEEAGAYDSSKEETADRDTATTNFLTQDAIVTTSSAATATDEIKELARGLQYDPKLIYDYVHNHIDYVPYYGSLKGAMMTYLDGAAMTLTRLR